MSFILILSSLAIAFSSWLIFKIGQNYNTARKIGLPILVTPVAITGLIWQLFEYRLRPLLRRVPFGLCSFIDYSGLEWMWRGRYTLHERLGPAFIVVTPSEVMIVIADSDAAHDMLSRRKDFIKPRELYLPFEIFGPNVDTLNGEDWQRHRRITTPPFNERNSGHVWKESLRQATGMLKHWTATVKGGIESTSRDTLTLALHVLTSAGFGKSYEFESGVTAIPKGHTMSYRDALHTVLSNIFSTIILVSTGIPAAVLPRSMIEVITAINEFRGYMVEMVEEERASIQQEAEKDNLLSVLVRMSEEYGAKGRNGLSDEEILGNMFIYNLAGHDTTANTLSYAVALMASDLHWQDWIRQELESVFMSPEVADWDYNEAFPKLTRCMAVMYETLRLYGPVFVIPKAIGDTPTTLTIRGRDYILPPNAHVPINLSALHTSPQYWKATGDPLEWCPDRWIKTNAGVEELYQPPAGTFLPWAAGPRVCPGKKFSQVEFVAVIARLFRSHRVKPCLEPGEGVVEAKQRILDVVKDSRVIITLQMRHPEKVKLIWEKV